MFLTEISSSNLFVELPQTQQETVAGGVYNVYEDSYEQEYNYSYSEQTENSGQSENSTEASSPFDLIFLTPFRRLPHLPRVTTVL